VAAALTVRLVCGPGDFGQWLYTLFRWRVDPRWFLFSVAAPPVLLFAASAMGRVLPYGPALAHEDTYPEYIRARS
jgi:hypothetical protein